MCQNLSNLLVPCSWFLLKSASAFLSIHVPRYSTVPSTSHLTQKCLKLLTFQNLGSSVRLSLFHTVGKQLHAFLLMVIPLSWRLGNLALACFSHAAPAPLPSAASPGEHQCDSEESWGERAHLCSSCRHIYQHQPGHSTPLLGVSPFRSGPNAPS